MFRVFNTLSAVIQLILQSMPMFSKSALLLPGHIELASPNFSCTMYPLRDQRAGIEDLRLGSFWLWKILVEMAWNAVSTVLS